MTKSILLWLLATFLLTTVSIAEAQQQGKLHRIGFLSPRLGSATTDPHRIAFRQGLHELGCIEGANVVIEYRHGEGKIERLPELAAELVRLKVDVIVTSPAPPAILAAQQATRTIPIVMAGANVDPVAAGFVASLARPGGNITGLTNLEIDLHGKRLELLKEAFSRISRVAVLWPPTQQEQGLKEIHAAGQALGIQIQSLTVSRLGDLESAFSAISQESADAFLVASIALTLDNRARIIDFTAERRLPAMYGSRLFVDAGGLMFYAQSSADVYRHANLLGRFQVDHHLKLRGLLHGAPRRYVRRQDPERDQSSRVDPTECAGPGRQDNQMTVSSEEKAVSQQKPGEKS